MKSRKRDYAQEDLLNEDVFNFDSSDEEVTDLRSSAKSQIPINDEEPKEEGYLINLLKIFRHLQKNKPEHFEKEFYISTAISIHDFSSRLLRSDGIYNKYKEKKKEKFGLKKEEYSDLKEELREVFFPIVHKHYKFSEITDFEVKALFHFTFDHTCTLPTNYSSTTKRLKCLREELLDALKKHELSGKSNLSSTLQLTYNTNLELGISQRRRDKSDIDESEMFDLFLSVLLDIRNIKNMTKSLAVSGVEKATSTTMIYFSNLGTYGDKQHTQNVTTSSLNSISKVSNISTYKNICDQLPKTRDKANLLKSVILDIICNKAVFPLKMGNSISADFPIKIQNLSSNLAHLFFVECTRNNATIITFPMWLELWASDPEKYLDKFPMSIKGAVSNSRGINHKYSELIFKPIFMDLDFKNIKGADTLLTPEYELIKEWCEYNNIRISESILKDLSRIFRLETKINIQKEYLNAGDLHDIFEDSSELFPEYTTVVDINKKFQESKYAKNAKISKKPPKGLLEFYNQFQKVESEIKEKLELKKNNCVSHEVSFIQELFLLLEKKMLEWYEIEIPENLQMDKEPSDEKTNFTQEYFKSTTSSPFKKQKIADNSSKSTKQHEHKAEGHIDTASSDIGALSHTSMIGCFTDTNADLI